jgi:hypothetical protein
MLAVPIDNCANLHIFSLERSSYFREAAAVDNGAVIAGLHAEDVGPEVWGEPGRGQGPQGLCPGMGELSTHASPPLLHSNGLQ